MCEMNNQQLIDKILNEIPEPIYHQGDQAYFAEADYYGASRIIAEKLGLIEPPFSQAGWRHGWMHFPIKYVRQLTVWGKESTHYLMSQPAHVKFLAENNIKSTAVGIPFIYADYIDQSLRVPNTLLVMPPHTLPYIPSIGNEEIYVKEIQSIRDEFDAVVFCIHHSCIQNGVWPELLKKYNFPMIIGASASQTNSLIRLQRIFSSFEFVTSNTIGSHLPYAAYCGAKVSIYGKFSDFSNYNIEKDPYAKANPELMAFNIKHTAEPYVRQLVPFLFCDHPKTAQQYINWAQTELGLQYKKRPDEIAELLSWNDQNFQIRKAKEKSNYVKNKEKSLLLESLSSMFQLVTQYKNNFAVYGAGDIGTSLINLLSTNNFKPLCIYDKRYETLNNNYNISICNPENIEKDDIKLILIASFSHQEEIKEYITSLRKDLVIWPTY